MVKKAQAKEVLIVPEELILLEINWVRLTCLERTGPTYLSKKIQRLIRRNDDLIEVYFVRRQLLVSARKFVSSQNEGKDICIIVREQTTRLISRHFRAHLGV